MINIDDLYFDWLIMRLQSTSPGVERMSRMLHRNVFCRDVGNDINRANSGSGLREIFLDDYYQSDIDVETLEVFLGRPCSWFEMLVAFSEKLDYLYDGGVFAHYIELTTNLGLTTVYSRTKSLYDEIDQDLVDAACERVDRNLFSPNGHGGLFPLLSQDHPDQREVEIWEQHSAYFRERLEGVLWTSIR